MSSIVLPQELTDRISLSSVAELIFSPLETVQIPNIEPSFPAIPSARYYYLSRNRHKIPMANIVGNLDERNESLKIWYSMKSDDVFYLRTSYAISRNDQIGLETHDRPLSEISLSMKSYIKQYPDSHDWFFDDRFQFILGQMKRRSLSDFLGDFYRFPLNPEANAFEVAMLLEQYVRDGDEEPLRNYLKNAQIWHLAYHSFGYYPIYELFFLLTRFASYPMNENQLYLSERRNRTAFDSPERIFIDAIFHYEIYDVSKVLDIIDKIEKEGPLSTGQEFKTNSEDWVRWADEYLQNMNKEPRDIKYMGERIYKLADDLNTWTDLQIAGLAQEYNVSLPIRKEYPARYPWVIQIAAAIKRSRDNLEKD